MIRVKNKRKIVAVGVVAILAAVGGTIAMNRTIFPFNNDFELSLFKTELTEEFDSPTGWKPCDTTDKIVSVKNTGDIPAKARIKMDESWIAKDGETELELIKDGVKLATVSFSNEDWVLDDGYYYLNKTLQPGESSEFINAVSFNCEANFAENTMVDGEGNEVKSTDRYNGASFHLGITAQMMQAKDGIDWADAFNEYKEPQSFSKLASSFMNNMRNARDGRTLTGIKRSKVLPNDISSSANMTEVQQSGETPIYLWYSASDTSLYWYSMADAISWPTGDSLGGFFAGALFQTGTKATDISGMRDWDMRNVNTLGGFFYGNDLPDDMSAIAHWKLTGVTALSGAFSSGCPSACAFKQKHMSALEFWDVSNVTDMSGAFGSNGDITDLSMLKNWDVRNLKYLSGTFYKMTGLTSLKGLEKWKTNSLINLGSTFSQSSYTDISALANWNVSGVTSFNTTFAKSLITDLSPIAGWDVSSGESFDSMFEDGAVSNATVLNDWSVPNAATLVKMFYNTNCTESTYPTWYTSGRRS